MRRALPDGAAAWVSGRVRSGRVTGMSFVRRCRTHESIVAGSAHTAIPAAREMRGNGRKAVI